ncbi:hypothetical protein F2Q69_00060633 [Brassica cretica]|uniref:DUF4283 domain-containing protein n=1 Tax=Brassica cretica TaxID=69181 RepID=A0A8S9RML7_BRACR|nr:hypothetical protein F2Q69_00060633 [Brassica cretica]
MYRPKKKKEMSLMKDFKERNLLGEGEPVDIPDLENDDLIEENTMSVVVRCLNPTVHKVGGLVKALPPILGLEDRVKGRGVGDNRAQFIFQCDRDLRFVLERGPWFVNGWIVSMDQWTPSAGPDFLSLIPFWIRISGIPIHLLKKQAVEGLISLLGKVDKFRKTANFKTGEAISTELEYEKPLKVCFRCKRLTHDRNIFPLRIHAEDQAVALEEGPSRMRNSHSHASGKDKGKAVMELVWRKKETPEAAKPTEGGSSNSVGDSIQSSLRKTKSHEKKASEEDRSAGFSSRNLTVSPTVFQRLGSSPHSSELEEGRSSVFARQGDLSPPLEIVISRRGQSQIVWRLQVSFIDSVEYPPALVLTQKVNILIMSM